MSLIPAVNRAVATASSLWIGLLLPCLAPAQDCLDYVDYLHWSNGVETPGWCEAIVLDGNLGYVANGSDDGDGGSISILEMTTLRDPRILSTLPTPGFALDIAAKAGLICVADGLDGLTVVQAADPGNPSIVGQLQEIGFVRSVAMLGSIVLVGADSLYAVDLSEPSSPVILDRIEAFDCSRIVVDGTRAYVASTYYGILIIDIGDPSDLRLLGTFDLTGYVTDVAVSLPYVYFAASTYGFGVVDVSDPAQPIQVGWSPTPAHAQGVAVRGGRAYVVDGDELSVFNVEVPDAPTPLGRIPLPESPHAVTLAGDYAFIPSGYPGVQIVEIEHDWPAEPLGDLAPVGQTNDVAVSGRYAYLADGPAGLVVVDLVDPASPLIVGTAALPGGSSAFWIAAEGSRVCILDAARRAHTIDVSEPSKPEFLAQSTLPAIPHELVLSGGWAFIPCGSSGLVMLDLNDGRDRGRMWVYDTPGWADDVAVQGHLAYVVDSYGLLILDVTNPPEPLLVGQSVVDGSQISVDGDYACLSRGYDGIALVDIRDPANLALVAECDLPNYTLTVALSWPYVYSPNEQGGLLVHRVDGPGGFVFAGSLDLLRNTGTVVRAGNLLLVPQWDHGLRLLRPQCGDAAAVPGWTDQPVAVALRIQNPFVAPGVFRLDLRRSTDVLISIFEPSGRRVAKVADRRFPAGESEILWDGRDDHGGAVKSGVYLVSCRTVEGTSAGKLTVIR